MNKQMLGFWERYRHTTSWRTIYDAYHNPNDAKVRSYNQLIRFMQSVNGYLPTIVSYNTFSFTFGFLTDDEFYYITPSHTYHCKKEELPQ